MFLRHEGYLCAIGAFLKGVEEEGNSWFGVWIQKLLRSFIQLNFACLCFILLLCCAEMWALRIPKWTNVFADAEKYSWGEFTTWGENYAGSSSDLHSPRLFEMFPRRERSATVSAGQTAEVLFSGVVGHTYKHTHTHTRALARTTTTTTDNVLRNFFLMHLSSKSSSLGP